MGERDWLSGREQKGQRKRRKGRKRERELLKSISRIIWSMDMWVIKRTQEIKSLLEYLQNHPPTWEIWGNLGECTGLPFTEWRGYDQTIWNVLCKKWNNLWILTVLFYKRGIFISQSFFFQHYVIIAMSYSLLLANRYFYCRLYLLMCLGWSWLFPVDILWTHCWHLEMKHNVFLAFLI